MILISYVIALASLLMGTAAVYMALMPVFPVRFLYVHYFIRKPVVWTLLFIVVSLFLYRAFDHHEESWWIAGAVLFCCLGVALTYRMHQESAFRAVDFPPMTSDVSSSPLTEKMQLALIEYNGATKAYPLQYVIHHHIVNDDFNGKLVSLTYCAMCRSIIPFDVSDIGPLFVTSFKNANMIVADRRTKTWFQQATFESILGKLHPHTLKMIPFQILSWSEVKGMRRKIAVADVVARDLREFELPIPGIWKRIMGSDATPGLPAKMRDHTLPARTRIIGILDSRVTTGLVYLKSDVIRKGTVTNREHGFVLIASDDAVNGFLVDLNIQLYFDGTRLLDRNSPATWDMSGKAISGGGNDLVQLAISDEYWFSWKQFHSNCTLVQV